MRFQSNASLNRDILWYRLDIENRFVHILCVAVKTKVQNSQIHVSLGIHTLLIHDAFVDDHFFS